MNQKTDLSGQTALVTGASSGLGVDFARELAARGADLVLVARREGRLRAVRDELVRDHGVAVYLVPMDLGTEAAPERLYAAVRDLGLDIDILVNNAGFGLFGDFLDISWERERAMLQLDIVTLVHLTRLFAADMRARGRGRILQIASIGAYQPTPTYASYAAAKAFVLSHGEAINEELRGTGVTCTVLSPGITRTEFLDVSGQEATFYQRMVMMDSPEVARTGIRAMLAGRASVVPGVVNALTAQAVRLLPRRVATALGHALMKN